jgi:hypothetical protein
MCASMRITGVTMIVLLGLALSATAQTVRGVVLDQTELPLPGVTIDVMEGTTVTATIMSGGDGTFEIPEVVRGSRVVAKLEGFEPATLLRGEATRIVLQIARATTTTVVIGSALSPESPITPLLGNTLTATDIARLPNSRLQARESLPLLPSVIRGNDGLMRLGGARPSETPMLLDGFDVTDPATGITSISLAYEAVSGVEVLRDPMSASYGGLMGALFKMETRAGDQKRMGLQGFIPRPRFQSPGFGRIEGIFPRFFMGRQSAGGRVRFFGAIEYNFERIVVPDVTQGSGPNIVEKSGSVFGRVDIDASPQHQLTLQGFIFPSATDLQGLSVRREEAATPDVSAEDIFGGLTSRRTFGNAALLTIRAGVLAHNSRIRQNGTGAARLSPAGWRENWFARVARNAIRYSAAVTLDKSLMTTRGTHDVTVSGSVRARMLTGSVTEDSVLVENDRGDLVRAVHFGTTSPLSARDLPYEASLRDLWRVTSRLQVDAGSRIDGINRYGALPSARAGVRYALDDSGLTVLKAGVGNFVGKIPLAAPAFAGYPARTELRFDEVGRTTTTSVFNPTVDRLRMPNAFAVTVQLERQIRPGMDAQVGFTRRRSTRLATLDVPVDGGPLAIRSNGRSTYEEYQVSVRQLWRNSQQLFVSYVRSSARGELNDFMTLFTAFDQPLLQPGGMARLPADAPHRWLAWGTVNTPLWGLVVSPVMEWHSGCPYSVVNEQYLYHGEPNTATFPAFMAVDMIAYKTVTYKNRAADVGFQLFNLTNHENPRDVYPVIGAQRYGTYTNSVGPIVRGFMMIKW